MCKLCQEENIKDYHEYLRTPHEKREDCIVHDNIWDFFGYWVEENDEEFCGWRINLNYCPYCGRELKWQKKIN